MARYCFYCGRTLQSGDKCNCRSTGESGHSSAGPAESENRQQTQSTSNTNKKSQSGTRQTSGRQKQKQKQTTESASERASRFTRSAAERRAAILQRLPALAARLQTVSRYVLQPVDAIRSSVQHPSLKRSIGFFAFQIVLSGFLMMTVAGTGNPLFAALFGSSAAALHPGLLFLGGAALSLTSLLLLGLAYSLLLRYAHRRTFRFQALAEALGPVSLYLGLFLLFALFSLRTSVITAAILLLTGLAVSLLVQFFTIRQLTAMDENRLVMLVFSASFLSSSVIGLLFGLA